MRFENICYIKYLNVNHIGNVPSSELVGLFESEKTCRIGLNNGYSQNPRAEMRVEKELDQF